ncbi:MAG: hypothetical protein P8Y58_04740 [Novosphingobium sp.]
MRHRVSRLTAHDIRFEPGLDEELAATSVRGTQRFGWHAKDVGVERAGEAIKAANFEGTHRERRVAAVRGRSRRQVLARRAPVGTCFGHGDGVGALSGDDR